HLDPGETLGAADDRTRVGGGFEPVTYREEVLPDRDGDLDGVERLVGVAEPVVAELAVPHPDTVRAATDVEVSDVAVRPGTVGVERAVVNVDVGERSGAGDDRAAVPAVLDDHGLELDVGPTRDVEPV